MSVIFPTVVFHNFYLKLMTNPINITFMIIETQLNGDPIDPCRSCAPFCLSHCLIVTNFLPRRLIIFSTFT